jgi:hypothetical protein
MTLSNQSKNSLSVTNQAKSYDYALEDLDIAIEDMPGTFEDIPTILTKPAKNSLSLTNQSL